MKRFFDKPFYYCASPEIIKRAQALRDNMTPAETTLWERISRSKFNGYYFRRQHPISRFIVDFYCHELLLAIELDGGVHSKSEVVERDEGRQYELENLGLRVIRFNNEEVLNNIDNLLSTLNTVIEHINSSSLGGRI
jgi:very-short-patch-repair endonuclease